MPTRAAMRRGMWGAALLAASCATTLPDQDRRIVSAVPVAKTTADILWKEYQDAPADANKKYWGQAVELAGRVTSVSTDTSPQKFVMLEQHDGASGAGVRANLLDDQASEILGSAVVGQRLRLKCFCAGLSGNLILKSCIKP